ncbi:MAG: hypothetical protein LQ351_007968 [Letrouitia transgressa]|nr:MAG: hypothetical protein LQ351_007968 [Letrouitia transgressa]
MSVRTVTIPEGVATAKSTASNSDAAEKGQGYCPAYIKPSTQKISVTGKDIVNPFELDSTESPIKFYVFDEKGLKHRWVHKNPKLILETIETMFDEISGYDRVNIDNLEDLEFKLITSRESIITFESIVYPLKRDTSQDIFGDMKVDVNEYIKKSRIEEPRCRCDINITPIYSSHNKAQDHRCI